MASACPRLATAAVFMTVGVIQLLAGVILLRSKYTDLLSGPDFVAGSSNMAVACIYGTISSIWKTNKKSSKITARKNVLAALLLSVITLNVTAAIILLMSDGNRLLDLYLENNQDKVIDFASEVLAYAYITSVCSPVICIVVALVVFSGRCIEMCRDLSSGKAKNSITNDDSYNWDFDPKTSSNVKVVFDATEASTESTSASEDSVFTEEKVFYSRRKSVQSTENISSPLHMRNQEQVRSLHVLHQESGQHYIIENPDFYTCSHERLIPRIKESSLKKDINQEHYDWDKKPSKTVKSILKRSSSSPVSRGMKLHASNRFNDPVHSQLATNYNIPYRYGYDQETDSENQENRVCKHLKSCKITSSRRNKRDKLARASGKPPNLAEETNGEEMLFMDPVISELKAETLKELKQKVTRIFPEAPATVMKLPNWEEQHIPISESSDVPNSNQKPHCPEVSRYKLFTNPSENSFSSAKQLLSDEASDSFRRSSYSSENSPRDQCAFKNKSAKTGFSVISKIRSKSFDYGSEDTPFQNQDESQISSLQLVNENFPLDSQKANSPKQQNKKCDSSRKISMASIAEIPFEEHYSERNLDGNVSNSSGFDENSNIKMKISPSTRHVHLMKAAKRKSSKAPNNLLKRMWSSSEPKINVSDLIVDQDSLIGLSEEELVARTFRIRSLRKTVEDRAKKENCL